MSYVKVLISKKSLAKMIIESQYSGLNPELIDRMSNVLINKYNDTSFVKIARKMTDLNIAKGANSYYFLRYAIN